MTSVFPPVLNASVSGMPSPFYSSPFFDKMAKRTPLLKLPFSLCAGATLVFFGWPFFANGESTPPNAMISLSENGETRYAVALPASPSPAERNAAKELSEYLRKITGADFSIVEEGALPAGQNGLYIGDTKFAKDANVDVEKLGEEEWVITATPNRDVIITGGFPRGTLYGVYEFLEKHGGCLWLDSISEVIPANPSLTVPANLDEKNKPAFSFRGIYTDTPADEAKRIRFRARNKHNYYTSGAENGFGVRYGAPQTCHTFYFYSEDFPEDHPEYFSLSKSGERLRAKGPIGPGQVCLTNPDVRRLFLQKLKSYIGKDRSEALENDTPAPGIYDISHNDNVDKCECEECLKFAEKEGSYSGLMIDFINELADGIKEEYPEIKLQTFAYTFTEKAPKSIRLRDNVILRLAPLGVEWMPATVHDTLRPFSDPVNHQVKEVMQEWSEVAPHLSMWDYWILYREPFPTPYINLDAVASNLRLYKNSGVVHVFSESESPEKTTFFPLKRWIGLKLMQNPDQPLEPLVDRFVNGFYSKSAAPMKEYLYYLGERMKEVNGPIANSHPSKRPYLDLAFYAKVNALFDQAEALSAGDPEILPRIQRERIPVDASFLYLWSTFEKNLQEGSTLPFDKDAVIKRYLTGLSNSIERYYPAEEWSPLKKRAEESLQGALLAVPLPESFDEQKTVDLLWPTFQASQVLDPEDTSKHTVYIVDDKEAAGGKALKLGSARETVHPDFHARGMDAGVYYPLRKGHGPLVKLKDGELIADGKYHLYRIGAAELSPDACLWVHWSWYIQLPLVAGYDSLNPENKYVVYVSLKVDGPAYNPDSSGENAIYVDRILLAKEE